MLIVYLLVQATAAAQINASVLTAGDYTVYITGVAHGVNNAELVEFASHYGEVMAVHYTLKCHVCNDPACRP